MRVLNALGDRLVSQLVDGYFTKASLITHALVYPLLMGMEGGDYHLFLDGISIEAVFVGLLVGISTKRTHRTHHHVLGALGRLLSHHERDDHQVNGERF